MPALSQDAENTAAVDFDELERSHGYRVDDPNGRVGVVDGIVAGTWLDRPDGVEVRVGLFRSAILLVPVGIVAGVDPHRRRVVLREPVDLGDALVP
jgi:hypothetical protein